MTYQEVPGATPIAEVRYRQRARVAGRIRSVRVQPWGGAPSLECILGDASNGEILAVFLGRRDVPGIRPGTQVVVEGTVGQRRGRLAILNPRYQLLSVREAPPSGEG